MQESSRRGVNLYKRFSFSWESRHAHCVQIKLGIPATVRTIWRVSSKNEAAYPGFQVLTSEDFRNHEKRLLLDLAVLEGAESVVGRKGSHDPGKQ